MTVAYQDPATEAPSTTKLHLKPSPRSMTHHFLVVTLCVAWMVSSSCTVLVNRYLMKVVDFPYPMAVSSLGLTGTTICSTLAWHLFLKPRHTSSHMTLRTYLTSIAPTGLFMALSFTTGNTAYIYLSVPFAEMLKALGPVITMIVGFMFQIETLTAPRISSIIVITSGVVLASLGEVNGSVYGASVMLLSLLVESLRLVQTQMIVRGGLNLHPVESLMYIGWSCLACILPAAVFFELPSIMSTGAWSAVMRHPLPFIVGASLGCFLNAAALGVIRLTSSLYLKLLANAKNAGVVIYASIVMREPVTEVQLLGYSVSLIGFVAYNIIKSGPPSSLAGGKTKLQ